MRLCLQTSRSIFLSTVFSRAQPFILTSPGIKKSSPCSSPATSCSESRHTQGFNSDLSKFISLVFHVEDLATVDSLHVFRGLPHSRCPDCFHVNFRACMNASLMSRTRMPKDLSLAARLIRYLIPNVSGVAAHMSSRYCPALNCRTRNLHWTLSPRHPPTQTMSSALCSGGNLCTSSNASFFFF